MLSYLKWCIVLLAIFYCVRSDEDYNCWLTQNNTIEANMMCQYSVEQSYSTCQRYCTRYAAVDDAGYCVTNAYDCRGGCDMESKFKLMVGGTPYNAPKFNLDCCNVTATENAIVCAKCGFGTSAYYTNMTAKLVKGCTCTPCRLLSRTTDKIYDSMRDLFSHSDLTSSEVEYNHN